MTGNEWIWLVLLCGRNGWKWLEMAERAGMSGMTMTMTYECYGMQEMLKFQNDVMLKF